MSSSFLLVLEKIINDPKNKPLLSIIKGIRNGIVYGCKIRFPHALVMTFLFRQGSLKSKILMILTLTATHAKNLAHFVIIYKSMLYFFRLFAREIHQYHTVIAAFIGGYYVFGKKNSVNEQINMYLLSRCLIGLTRCAQEAQIIPKPKKSIFPWYSAVVWAFALWLFEYHKHNLQPSLQASMTYLYHDSTKWTSLRNFIVYNK